MPTASSRSPTYTRSPSSRSTSPSLTFSRSSGPTPSINGISASTRISGPRFGYRPLIEREASITAATPALTRPSALTRSRSSWSITAISPGWIRVRRSFVRRSTRAAPAVGRGLRRGRSRLLDLDVDVRIASPDVVVRLGPEREDPRLSDHRKGSGDPVPPGHPHVREVDHHDMHIRMAVDRDLHPLVRIFPVEPVRLDLDDHSGDRCVHSR